MRAYSSMVRFIFSRNEIIKHLSRFHILQIQLKLNKPIQRGRGIFFIVTLIVNLCLNLTLIRAQSVDWIEQFQNRNPSRFLFSAQSELTEGRLSRSPYVASKLFLQFQESWFRLQLIGNLNKEQTFLLPAGRLIVNLQNGNVIDEGLSVPPNRFVFDYPILTTLSILRPSWHVGVSLAGFNQSFTKFDATLIERSEGIFSIQWSESREEINSILMGVRGGFKIGNMNLNAGLMPLEVARFGKIQSGYSIESRFTPFVEIEYETSSFSVGAIGANAQAGLFALLNTNNFLVLNADPIQTSLRVSSSLNLFEFQLVQANIGIPINEELAFTLGVEKLIYPNDKVFLSNFRQWAQNSTFNWQMTPTNYWQSQSLRAGVVLKFGEKKGAPVFRVVDSRLLQRQVYQAKRAFYAHNPIALLTIHNTEKKSFQCQLLAEDGAGLATFRSEPFMIEANEYVDVPIYLYLSGDKFKVLSQSSQLRITVLVEGFSVPLTTLPITFFDANSWDGDTWTLKYFVSPNDELIQANAKRAYISATKLDSLLQHSTLLKFSRLKHVLSTLGEGLTYISDATTSLFVDQVQYPSETLVKKSGDCEDMVVFIASSLMAIGINVALVDVRPKRIDTISVPTAEKETIGHLFILVDTGIEPEHLAKFGLTEFQSITRKNVLGKPTLWIPIETTVLNKGFDEALLSGARQYYNEVILKNGIQEGSVQIYDF